MNALGFNEQQLQKMKNQPGFVAALDQSGGSTPKALAAYGIKEGSWSNEEEMFAIVHQMRTRIITSPSFNGDRILGAILFENTMDRDIQGRPTADYLWNVKRVVPFLKVDNGLAEEKNGVRLMKPMPQFATLLKKAKAKGIFGTKMRSVINQAEPRRDQRHRRSAVRGGRANPCSGPCAHRRTGSGYSLPRESQSRGASLKSLYSKSSTGCLPDNWYSSNSRCRSKTICMPIASDIPRW